MIAPLRYEGLLYRAINPIYAREPLSGEGAKRYGGRFNRKGTPALYLSLSIPTACREANQAGRFQPIVVVSYEAKIDGLFDGRDANALAEFGMSAQALADDSWRNQMAQQGVARTQTFADQLSKAGHNGLLVRSFAHGATNNDLNIVLWRWGAEPPVRLVVIDDEGRLSR